MLAKLVRENCGIKPIEGKVATIDHLDETFEHLGFFPNLIAEAEVMATFDKAQHTNLL